MLDDKYRDIPFNQNAMDFFQVYLEILVSENKPLPSYTCPQCRAGIFVRPFEVHDLNSISQDVGGLIQSAKALLGMKLEDYRTRMDVDELSTGCFGFFLD